MSCLRYTEAFCVIDAEGFCILGSFLLSVAISSERVRNMVNALMGPSVIEVVAVLAHQSSQVTLTENDDVVQTLTSDTANEALDTALVFGARTGVLRTSMSSVTYAKCVPYFLSLSQIKNRGPSPNGVALRHCRTTQPSLGDRVTLK